MEYADCIIVLGVDYAAGKPIKYTKAHQKLNDAQQKTEQECITREKRVETSQCHESTFGLVCHLFR